MCAVARAAGISEAEAARRVGVSIERLRVLLDGLRWRSAEGIPLGAVRAAIQRRKSQEGHTLEEAAALLGVSLAWVKARKRDDTVRVAQARCDRRVSAGELACRGERVRRRYHRKAVRARARRYWASSRFQRARRPGWLDGEKARQRRLDAQRRTGPGPARSGTRARRTVPPRRRG